MKKTDLKKANVMMTPPAAKPEDASATGSFAPANTVDQVGAQSMTSPKNTPQSVSMGFATDLDSEVPFANKEDFKAKIKEIQAKVAAEAQKGHKDEKCEKCGDVGHDMEKCWMGKSLNDMKKSQEKGVHSQEQSQHFGKDKEGRIDQGVSVAGAKLRSPNSYEDTQAPAKIHKEKLGELKAMPKPKLTKDAFPLVDKSEINKGKSLNQMKKDDMAGSPDMMMAEKKGKSMEKSKVAGIRSDMATSQGVKPTSTGIVPNVKQDLITGEKTPIGAAKPPQASLPSAPKAPSAPKTSSKTMRPVSPKLDYGKVIMKSGMSLNDLKKAHDDYKDYDGDLDQPEHEPDHDDIFFHPTGPLGSHTAFSVEGKHKSTHKFDEEAHAAAKDWSKANKVYPNAWNVSDHGNHHLIENFHAESAAEAPSKGKVVSPAKEKALKAKAIVKKIKK